MRMVMEVMGRSFCSRFFTRLFMLIEFSFLRRGQPGGNDADGPLFALRMHDAKQSRTLGVADGGLARFFFRVGVGQPEERVKEHLAGFVKNDAVLSPVACRLLLIPLEILVREERAGRPRFVYTMYVRSVSRENSAPSRAGVSASRGWAC